jgi:hypothetical protein
MAALWVVIFHFCWYFPAVHPERSPRAREPNSTTRSIRSP